MAGFQPSPIDLLWAIVVAIGFLVFAFLRRPGRTAAAVALLAVATIAACWLVLFAWAHYKYATSSAESAFNSVEYLDREVPTAWIVQATASGHGWIPGVFVFAIAWGAALLWSRRAP